MISENMGNDFSQDDPTQNKKRGIFAYDQKGNNNNSSRIRSDRTKV